MDKVAARARASNDAPGKHLLKRIPVGGVVRQIDRRRRTGRSSRVEVAQHPCLARAACGHDCGEDAEGQVWIQSMPGTTPRQVA